MAYISGRRRDRIVGGFTTTCGKVPITTEVVRWNPAHGELYSIQYYVIKFVRVSLSEYSSFLHHKHHKPNLRPEYS